MFKLVVASDVTSPLLGPTGAASCLRASEGPTAAQVAQLDAGLEEPRRGHSADPGVDSAQVIRTCLRVGSGQAVSVSRRCFSAPRTSPVRSISWTCWSSTSPLADVDLVITGEGRLDDQTLHGKLPAAVALRAAPTPVVAVVGRNDLGDNAAGTHFADVLAVADYAERDTSGDPWHTAELLQHIGTHVGRKYSAATPTAVP